MLCLTGRTDEDVRRAAVLMEVRSGVCRAAVVSSERVVFLLLREIGCVVVGSGFWLDGRALYLSEV